MRGLFALLAVGLVPGLLLTGATHPSADSLRTSERLLLGLVGSLCLALIGGLVLVRAEALSLGPIAAWLTASSLAGALAAHRRGCRLRAIVARAQQDLATAEGLTAFAMIAATGIAIATRQLLDPFSSPQPAWNYLGDMFAMLEVAGLPESTLDYGVPFHFETNKIAWYLAGAQWLSLGGFETAPGASGPDAVLGVWSALWIYVPFVATAFALAVWVFASTLYARPATALLATALLLVLPRVVYKISGLRGEALALAVFFALASWIVRCTRSETRSRAGPGDVWVTAVLAALLALLHLVPAAVAGLWGGAFALARLAVEGRRARAGVVRLVAAAAIGAVLITAVWAAVPRSPLASQTAISNPQALGPYRGLDPAHAFLRLVFQGPATPQNTMPYRDPEIGGFTFHPLRVLRELHERSALPHPAWPLDAPWLLAVGIGAALWMLRRHAPEQLSLGLSAPLLFAALYAMGLWFSHRYHTFLPAEHPWRREFMYLQLVYAITLAGVVEATYRGVAGRLGAKAARAIAAVLCAAVVLPIAAAGFEELRAPRGMGHVQPAGLEALAWLRSSTPADARILMDGSSVGLVGTLADRTCISEGRAPYFQPQNLRIALDTLAAARRFFADASTRDAFVRGHAIDYVVTGSEALGSRPFAAQPLRIDSERFPVVVRFGPIVVHRVQPES